MARVLQKYGNSFALVFDKPLMDALNMTPDIPLQINVSGGPVIITPVHVG
jgi:antitoxin component of MazEF toxin-antitoxin module